VHDKNESIKLNRGFMKKIVGRWVLNENSIFNSEEHYYELRYIATGVSYESRIPVTIKKMSSQDGSKTYYQIYIKSCLEERSRVFFEDDLGVAKLKGLLKAKEMGWEIKSLK